MKRGPAGCEVDEELQRIGRKREDQQNRPTPKMLRPDYKHGGASVTKGDVNVAPSTTSTGRVAD